MLDCTFRVPDSVADALGPDPGPIADLLRLAAAAKLFELGRLTSGAAAALAGLPRAAFLARLDALGVPVLALDGPEDLDAEAPLVPGGR